jgi:hypothetical protein
VIRAGFPLPEGRLAGYAKTKVRVSAQWGCLGWMVERQGPCGKTYSQLSAQAMAQPGNTKLAGLVATVFKGETPRSMLLNAYGWWKVSQIAYISGRRRHALVAWPRPLAAPGAAAVPFCFRTADLRPCPGGHPRNEAGAAGSAK